MRQPARVYVLWGLAVALLVVGLAASSILLVDYLKPAPVYCDEGGGCGVMKQTVFAHLGGIPTPAFGFAGMLLLAALLLSPAPWAPVAFVVVSTLGGFVSAYLIWIQAQFGVYCVYCMTFDTAMVLLPIVGALRMRSARLGEIPPRAVRLAGSGLLTLAAIVPPIVGHFRKPHVPDAILAEMENSHANGKAVTVVDFVDFQCPYCRLENSGLEPLLERDKDKIRLVRKNIPLTRIHAHADSAARAEVCATKQGKGDPMASRLFSIDEDELTQEQFHKVAGELGLDVTAFDQCCADDATEKSIQDDIETFKSVGGHGLPLLYIDTKRIEGAQDGPTLDADLRQAESARGI